jgi:hypothetical protein
VDLRRNHRAGFPFFGFTRFYLVLFTFTFSRWRATAVAKAASFPKSVLSVKSVVEWKKGRKLTADFADGADDEGHARRVFLFDSSLIIFISPPF